MTGKAIYALLSAATGVTSKVSTRIFPDMATQTAIYPFIVYSVIATDPTDTKEGVSALDAVTVSVVSYATKYTDAVDLSEAVRTALDRKTGTHGTISVQSIRFSGQRSLSIEWDKHVYIIEQEYVVRQNR